MWLGAVARSLCLGVFLAAISLAAQWVYEKQALVIIDRPEHILYTALPAVLGAAVLLLVLMPRNKALAARMDERLSLHEKVQTMIALRDDPSDMAALQREDAEAAIAASKRRRVRSVFSWAFFALPLIGAVAIYGALLVPIRAQTPPAVEAPEPVVYWQFDIYTEQKLRTLIDDVKKSDMEEAPRDAVVGELEGLIIRLRPVNLESVMQENVLRTATNIHTAVTEHNTYDVVAASMLKSASDPVRKLGNSIQTLKPLLVNEQLEAIGELLTPAEESDTAEQGQAGRAAVAAEIAAELRASVARSALSETDPLNATVLAFAAALEGVTDETDDRTVAAVITEAKDAFDRTLAVPLENEVVEETTLSRLMEIFGMTLPDGFLEDSAYNPLDSEDYFPDEDDKELSGIGGIGSGEVHYGSNDTIYDDVTGEYMTYGEVLARYHASVIGQIEDLSGQDALPADLEDMLSMYFERLDGSTKNETD